MKLDRSWLLLVGLVAGLFTAVASRRRQHRGARTRDDHSQIGSWENEGGNLPPAATPADHAASRTYRSTTRPRMFAPSAPLPHGDSPPSSNVSLHAKATPCDMT
jgi:hypothetical protein